MADTLVGDDKDQEQGPAPLVGPTTDNAPAVSHNPMAVLIANKPGLIHSAPFRVLSKIASAATSPGVIGAAKGLASGLGNIVQGAEEGLNPSAGKIILAGQEAPIKNAQTNRGLDIKDRQATTAENAVAEKAPLITAEAGLTAAKQKTEEQRPANVQADTALKTAKANAPAKPESPQSQAFAAALEKTKTADNPNGDPVAAYESLHGFKPVSLDIGGKPVGGRVNPESGEYQIQGTDGQWGPAPKGTHQYIQPNYGQMVLPTKTVDLISPEDGLPHKMGFEASTGTYSKDLGLSASGATGSRMSAASAANYQGKQVIDEINAHRDKLGDLYAWVQQYGLNTPIADPELAGLYASLKSFAALQPVIHGYRSTSALETFEKIVGGLQKAPDATIASIEGLMQGGQAVNPALRPKVDTPPVTLLKEGQITHFKNGQSWELKDGKAVRVDKGK